MIVAEAIQPIIKSLPDAEKRKLALWLEKELGAVKPVKSQNTELRARLIKHITKRK